MADDPVTVEQLQNALDDLITDEFELPMEDGDITITSFQQEVIRHVGACTWNTARKKIKKLEAAGTLA